MEPVTDKKKFLEENEIQTLRDLQNQTQEILLSLGEIEMVKLNLNNQRKDIEEVLKDVNNKEQEFAKLISEKYKNSSIDPSTGEIITID
tara:strand:- start:1580 stop:1846 length:267 start_codon:yes stop_codon:yes gene_type:complete